MKFKICKKMVRYTYHREKGFALLFSVLVSSLLLTIGLSILNISLKELAISTASRQSIHAFYAADSGREYTRYKDIHDGEVETVDLINRNPTDTAQDSFPEDYSTGGVISVVSGDLDGPNFYVTVEKRWHDDTTTKIDTALVSYGHDSASGDRVERAIYQTY